MNTQPSITALLEPLKVPGLSQENLTALNSLQHEWEQQAGRMNALTPERVLADHKAACKSFLETPTPENEQRLLVLADTQLTNRRHDVILQAYAELQRRTQAKAVELFRPVLERIQRAFAAELERRETSARKEDLNPRTDAGCIEMRRAQECISDELSNLDQAAMNPQAPAMAPMDLAAVLLAESESTIMAEA
jgi:hypothetical protein